MTIDSRASLPAAAGQAIELVRGRSMGRRWRRIRATARIDHLSPHAECEGLIGRVSRVERKPRSIRLVHGEPAATDAMRARTADRPGISCVIAWQDRRVALA